MPTVTRGQAAAEGNVPSSSSWDDSYPEFLQHFNLDQEVLRALLVKRLQKSDAVNLLLSYRQKLQQDFPDATTPD